MPTISAVLRPALLALLVGSIVPCQGVQKLIHSVPKSGENNSVAEGNATANGIAPTPGEKDSGAAVQLVSKSSAKEKDPHVIVHTAAQVDSKSSANEKDPHGIVHTAAQVEPESGADEKKPHVIVVKHAHTADDSAADEAPRHSVELAGVTREALLSGMNELAKDRKQLEANDQMLQEDVQKAAVQVQIAADQLEHASNMFASDRAELTKAADAARESADQANAEKGKLKLDVDKLLRERGKFADETHKNTKQQGMRSAKGLRRAELDNQRMVEGLKHMQERVASLTRERDAALKARAATEQALSVAQFAQKSSVPEAEELQMKAHRVDQQRNDFAAKANATANYWNAKYVATERALQNATRSAATLMTGAKMLYKSNKKLKDRVTQAEKENGELKQHHEHLERAVSDETTGKNVNAWYAKQIATAAQSGAEELKSQKTALQAKLDTLTKENRALHDFSRKLYDQFKASGLQGTITAGDAEKLYAELAWYKRNASVLEHTRLTLSNESAQLLETQQVYKQELDEARELLQHMAPWAQAESSVPGEMHAMSYDIKSAMDSQAQMKVIQHLAQEKNELQHAYEQVSGEKKRLEAQAGQGSSEMTMKQVAGNGMMGKLSQLFKSSGALEAKTHQLEATVQKVTAQNEGLMSKVDLLASGSQGELRQAIGLLTAENQRLERKVERISSGNGQAQEMRMTRNVAGREAKEASGSQLEAENKRLQAEISKVVQEKGVLTAKYKYSVSEYKGRYETLEANLQDALGKAQAASAFQTSQESSATQKALHERDEWIKSAMGLTAENVKLQASVNALTKQVQQPQAQH